MPDLDTWVVPILDHLREHLVNNEILVLIPADRTSTPPALGYTCGSYHPENRLTECGMTFYVNVVNVRSAVGPYADVVRHAFRTTAGREAFTSALVNAARGPNPSFLATPLDIRPELTVELRRDAHSSHILHKGQPLSGIRKVIIEIDFANGTTALQAEYQPDAALDPDRQELLHRTQELLAPYTGLGNPQASRTVWEHLLTDKI